MPPEFRVYDEYTRKPLPTAADLELVRRHEAVRKLLAPIRRLPDVGKHGDDCHLRYLDCLAQKVDDILAGES